MPKHQKPTKQKETRVLSAQTFEVRKGAAKDGGDMIVGYATKFAPIRSSDLGGWSEEIHPNAFDACLAANPDVRALWNHDANHILGRTTSGTLRLSVDSIGLKYEIDPPPTNMAKDIMISMERKDVTQSSFGFICTLDSWRQDSQGNVIRTVLKAELFDVSPVVFPAYPDATSGIQESLRSCPANLRRLMMRDDDDQDDDTDDDDTDECGCDCDACEGDDCANCTNTDCDGERCLRCAQQLRKAHLDLLRRRLG